MIPTPSVLLYAEDVFAGTKRTIGVAASRPALLEPIRRADPAEAVWLIAVDPASVAHTHEIELPPGDSNLDGCPAVALVADGHGGIASVAPAISVARGAVPPQQACLARSMRSHTQIGHMVAPPPDLLDATITFAVNGKVRLSSSLSSLVVTPNQLMESIARLVALRAGDIVLLGSPPGIASDTGTGWLTAGDRLEVTLGVGPQEVRLSAAALAAVREMAPRGRLPARVIGTGTNYYSHVEELGSSAPSVPTANFFKLAGSVCTSGTTIVIPPGSCVDYEGEIAVVIGEPLSDVSENEVGAADVSLCLANDVTAREAPTTHLSIAKSAAGFCPLGPLQVPISELHPSDVEFVVEVNGEPRQRGRADDMIFSIPELVASLSRAIDLRPGDVILTGSPAGVGAALTPQRFLEAGDVVRVTSPQLGVLENHFVAAATSRMSS